MRQGLGGSCGLGSESIRQVGEGKMNSRIQPSPLLRARWSHISLGSLGGPGGAR